MRLLWIAFLLSLQAQPWAALEPLEVTPEARSDPPTLTNSGGDCFYDLDKPLYLLQNSAKSLKGYPNEHREIANETDYLPDSQSSAHLSHSTSAGTPDQTKDYKERVALLNGFKIMEKAVSDFKKAGLAGRRKHLADEGFRGSSRSPAAGGNDARDKAFATGQTGNDDDGPPPAWMIVVAILFPSIFIVFALWSICAPAEPMLEQYEKEQEQGQQRRELRQRVKKHLMLTKLSDTSTKAEWRRRIGKFMDSPPVTCFIIALTVTDIECTKMSFYSEDTTLLNPANKEDYMKYVEVIALVVLLLMMVEQILQLIANGMDYFSHPLMVMDLIVINICFLTDHIFPGLSVVAFFAILFRLWKVATLVADSLDLVEG